MLGDLWASDPPPASMGQNAQAGLNKLWQSFSDWALGNKTNPDGTITHTTWTGYQLTIDPSIPKQLTGANQVISTSIVPGSAADAVSQSADNVANAPADLASSALDSVTGYIGNGVQSVANDIGLSITDNMVHMFVIFGLFGLGAFIIIEELS